jgi:chromate transport protein ChrA
MRLTWKKWDEYNPVFVMVGAMWMLGGICGLAVMGVSGPLALWLLRAIPAILAAMGLLVLIRQFQLRPKAQRPIVR